MKYCIVSLKEVAEAGFNLSPRYWLKKKGGKVKEEIDYSILPEHMRDGMQRYVQYGVKPGDFLYLVLSNDFVHALGQADSINTARIVDYAKFLYLELPTACWGSREKVDAWIKLHADARKAANEAKEAQKGER